MRKAKDNLLCRNCRERVSAGMNYCGHCGAAITRRGPEAQAARRGIIWPQRAEGEATDDWPVPLVDEASVDASAPPGIDLEPTVPSLVGPGSLIMPAPVSPGAPLPQAPSAPQAAPYAAPQAAPYAAPVAVAPVAPEMMPEFAAQVAAQVAAHIASTPQAAPIQAAPIQAMPVQGPAPLITSSPLVASHPLVTSSPLAETATSGSLRSRFLAATLELVTPGLGMMYVGNFWLGALVLVATLFATFLLIGVAMANAQVVHLADAVNFLGWLLLAHTLWLVTRMFWVWNMVVPRSSLSTA